MPSPYFRYDEGNGEIEEVEVRSPLYYLSVECDLDIEDFNIIEEELGRGKTMITTV